MAFYDRLLGGVNSFFSNPELQNVRNLIGTAGQIAVAEDAIDDLQGLGQQAQEFIGLPRDGQSLYETVASDTRFRPFSVSAAPGTTAFDSAGGATFNLSPDQQRLEQSLRSGGETLVNALLGRNEFGSIDPVTGQQTDNLRADQEALLRLIEVGDRDAQGRTLREAQEQQYIGTNRSFTDPFSADSLASSEQALFDRLQAIRAPQIERDRTALQNQLIAQGRQGLSTAQYGGSPQEFALEQAIQEQQSRDALSAFQQARSDATTLSNLRQAGVTQARTDEQLRSDQRLAGLRQQALEKELTGRLADTLLNAANRPIDSLLATTAPALDAAALANVSGRQLGSFGAELGASSLDYDLGAQQLATDLRREALNSLFGLLIAERQAAAQEQSAATSANASSGGNFFENLVEAAYPPS